VKLCADFHIKRSHLSLYTKITSPGLGGGVSANLSKPAGGIVTAVRGGTGGLPLSLSLSSCAVSRRHIASCGVHAPLPTTRRRKLQELVAYCSDFTALWMNHGPRDPHSFQSQNPLKHLDHPDLLCFWALSIVWYYSNKEQDLSDTRSVAVLRWRENDHSVGFFRAVVLNLGYAYPRGYAKTS
jgi:hypothetical protein